MKLMDQISFFENLKPRVVFVEDTTEVCSDFIKGAEFELFMETPKHYHIFHNGIFYGAYKEHCRKIVLS